MSDTQPPVEVTTRYATSVNTLEDAWAFVMAHIDKVGPDPSVDINPRWNLSRVVGDEAPPRSFEVVVSGMVEHPPFETGELPS